VTRAMQHLAIRLEEGELCGFQHDGIKSSDVVDALTRGFRNEHMGQARGARAEQFKGSGSLEVARAASQRLFSWHEDLTHPRSRGGRQTWSSRNLRSILSGGVCAGS
jgi:hypothetical protein